MATRVKWDDDEQMIADLLMEERRLRQRLATTRVKGGHDNFTVAATPATDYPLTCIPVVGTCEVSLNGDVLEEDSDYTVDYDISSATSGVLSVSVSLSSGDVLTARYLQTDWLVARSLPADTDSISDDFNRANSTTTVNPASDGGTWTVDGGVWGITSNRAYMVSETGGVSRAGEALVRRDIGTAAHEIIITNARNATTFRGNVWCGYDPATGDGYTLLFNSSNSFGYISRIAGDAYTTPDTSGSTTFTAWTGGTTRLKLTNDGAGLITAYQDTGSGWVQIAQLNDSGSPATGTWVGFSTNKDFLMPGIDKFDDFQANQL